MAHTPYAHDTKYWQAIDKLQEDMIAFKKSVKAGKLDKFPTSWDPIYDGDLSQIEHTKRVHYL